MPIQWERVCVYGNAIDFHISQRRHCFSSVKTSSVTRKSAWMKRYYPNSFIKLLKQRHSINFFVFVHDEVLDALGINNAKQNEKVPRRKVEKRHVKIGKTGLNNHSSSKSPKRGGGGGTRCPEG